MQLEDTNEKMAIRNRLSHLISEVANKNRRKKNNINQFDAVILSGEQCRFEHTLNTQLKFLAPHVKMNFIGVEKVAKRAYSAFRERAHNEHIAKCKLRDVFHYEYVKHDTGWIAIDKNKVAKGSPWGDNPKEGHNVKVFWADYCCEPSMPLFRETIDMAAGMRVGFVAITVCVKSRRGGKSDDRLIKRFKSYGEATTAEEAVLNGMDHAIKDKFKSGETCWSALPIRVVDISYAGGASGVKMITAGYIIGLPANSCEPIYERVGDRTERAKKDNSVLHNLKKRGNKDWVYTPKGRKAGKVNSKAAKYNMSVEMLAKLNTSVKAHEVMYNSYSKEQKLKLANKYGLTPNQYGAMIAQYHGALGKKRAMRMKAIA